MKLRPIPHSRARFAGSLIAVGALLSVRLWGAEVAVEEVGGFWEGKAEGGGLPSPIEVSLDIWKGEEKLTGIIACEYGVCPLDSVTVEGGRLTVTFFNPHLGPGVMSGEPEKEDGTIPFQWMFSESQGTGVARRIEGPNAPKIEAEKIVGVYEGIAFSPFEGEEFPLKIELRAEGEEIGGEIAAPPGLLKITMTRRVGKRIFMEGETEEGYKGMMIATVDGEILKGFWTSDDGVGRASLTKKK